MEYHSPSAPRSPPLRKHRRKVSALRLSSASLPPEYHRATLDDVLSDRPPDSADEADEETELDIDNPYVPHYASPTRHRHTLSNPQPHSASPRRQKRFLQQQQLIGARTAHKRRHSSTAVRSDSDKVDTYLDSLLERSVHALEMSNTLLESSISTQASVSALFSPEYYSGTAESALEERAIGLSSRLLKSWDVQDNWAEQLHRIEQGVDSLFIEAPTESMSRSLPSSSPLCALSPPLGRTPSMDQLHLTSQLRYAPQDRATLVSPAPRALTLDAILSDMLGAHPSFFHPIGSAYDSYTSTASFSNLLLPSSKPFSPALEPQLTNRHQDPSTPAYNMLSNLAARSSAANLNPSSSTLTLPLSLSKALTGKSKEESIETAAASAPSSFVSSFLSNMSSLRRRNSSPPPLTTSSNPSFPRRSSRSTIAPNSLHRPPLHKERSLSADQHSLVSSRSSRSSTRRGNAGGSPKVQVRQMTPPTEGTDEDAEGSSSSDGCLAKRTVVSLRKILDEQPPPAQPPPPTSEQQKQVGAVSRLDMRAPAFMPRSPAVVPSAGTSTATASISRLFTKGVHTSSSRPMSPPLRSVMKRRRVGSKPISPSSSVASFNGAAPPNVAVGSVAKSEWGSSGKNAFGIAELGSLVSRALSTASVSSGASASVNGSSTPSSGFSTPKRISFATLPESYASTKPEGEAGSMERRKRSSRRHRSGSESLRGAEDPERGDTTTSWWASWLGGADVGVGFSNYSGCGRDRERVEDRMTRRMTMGMHGGGHLGVLDEWGV